MWSSLIYFNHICKICKSVRLGKILTISSNIFSGLFSLTPQAGSSKHFDTVPHILNTWFKFFPPYFSFFPYRIISIYLCSLILSVVISILQICPSIEFLISGIVYFSNFNLVHLYVFCFTDFLSFTHYGYVFLYFIENSYSYCIKVFVF